MPSTNKIRVILTGASGMVGEGVLHECLIHPIVEAILVVTRRPIGVSHPKLKEIIHADFYDLTSIEHEFEGYDACFFCLGSTSVGKGDEEYYKLTYTLTLNFAQTLSRLNPEMTFEYVSGASTDTSEKGRIMWARVKGKTENDLMKLPFKHVYNFRPGLMKATEGMKNTLSYYKYIAWLYPVFRKLFPKHIGTLRELGLAMINAALFGYPCPHLEVLDIRKLSEQNG